jgi:thiamine-phosphate pyrophosphorylase
MNKIPAELLRIIDANINRTGEGLRVLEEVSRLLLNDSVVTQQLKDMRHQLVNTGDDLQTRLLSSRDAAGDVGSTMEVTGEEKSRDTSEIVIANARRVQESLRVLEELSKTPGLGLDSEAFRRARFALYTIEKDLLGRVARLDKVKKITGLYVVIDMEWLKGRKPAEVALQAISGGARVIQLRCKTGPERDFLSMADELKAICASKDVPFIVNDNLGVALSCGADGLHIGQEDLPAAAARKLLPIDMLLGVSARTKEEALKAVAEGADYLGVGAVFSTATKDSKALGLDTLKSIKTAVKIPIIAIGGINKDNVSRVMDTGVAGVAVISAVLGAKDVKQAAAHLADIIRENQHE